MSDGREGTPDFQQPDYLGDGVYVGHDGWHILLRLNTHLNVHSQIALEPAVLQKLVDYARNKGMKIK